jgi:hypothetical protein
MGDLIPSNINFTTLSYGFLAGAFVILAPYLIGSAIRFFKHLIHKLV